MVRRAGIACTDAETVAFTRSVDVDIGDQKHTARPFQVGYLCCFSYNNSGHFPFQSPAVVKAAVAGGNRSTMVVVAVVLVVAALLIFM